MVSSAAPCVIPNPCRLRAKDIYDISREVIAAIRTGPRAVFLLPNGVLRILELHGDAAEKFEERNPHSLVGIYDRDSRRGDIEDDLAAMERCR